MLAVVGDVHGFFGRFTKKLNELPEGVQDPIIQVGDLGVWPNWYKDESGNAAPKWISYHRPIWFIRGNHEYEPELVDIDVPTEIRPGLTFVPSGWIQELDGRLIGFLGGADSVIDRKGRTDGVDWWPSEQVTLDQVDRVASLGQLDLMITHCPPASVVRSMFGIVPSISAQLVERAWQKTGCPPLVCGHMHKHVILDQVRVLDILEIALV